MNSVHYDVIIYTNDKQKGVNKISELIKENDEMLFKFFPDVKYITDKRTYKIETNFNARGNRYYEAYIDNTIDKEIVNECIIYYCMPINNWKERIHYF